MGATWCMCHYEAANERRSAISKRVLLCTACNQAWTKAGKPKDAEGAPSDEWLEERNEFLRRKSENSSEAAPEADEESVNETGANFDPETDAEPEGDPSLVVVEFDVEDSRVDAEIVTLLAVLGEREFRPVDWQAKWIIAQWLRDRDDYAELCAEAGIEV